MDILQIVLDYVSRVPEWAFLYAVPAVIAASAIAFIFTSGRRWFFVVAALSGSAGFLAVYAKSVPLSLVYLGMLVAFTAVLSLLFFIPAPKRKGKSKMREERLFEKFHEELSEKSYRKNVSMPPKVCCFEREENGGAATAKEYGVSLSYADTLLKKLRSKKLKAGDRLETEELLRRLDCYREKPLDDGERSSLNDCLASILKLTAKYQL